MNEVRDIVCRALADAPGRRLDSLRAQVNGIDDALLVLINRRMALARAIGGCKRQNGAPVHDPQRERQVLERLAARNTGPLSGENLARIFEAIMAAARDVQHRAAAEGMPHD